MGKPITSQIQPELLARKKAAKSAVYSVSVPLAQFKRLSELLDNTEGDFTAECSFSAWERHTKVSGQWQAELGVVCQRCLGPMSIKVDVSFELICVESEAQANELSDDLDPVILDEDGMIHLVDLFEDDIILQLPDVARHEEGDTACVVGKMEYGRLPDNVPSEKPKPFAALKDLKKDLNLN